MAALCNILSPSFRNSPFIELKYFENKKLFSVSTGARKKYCAATSVSASRPQDYDQFYPNDNNIFQVDFVTRYEEKLENIRDHLLKLRELEEEEEEDPTESLIFVDTIQRLGVAGHYQKEIEKIMQQHYSKFGNITSNCGRGYHSLHDVSLSFRLFRQRGYHVSADVFSNFKGKDGKFRGELKQDIWGLVELYEATHLSFEGENILNEAHEFSSQVLNEHLAVAAENTKSKWSNVVEMRLRHPYHRSISRLLSEKNFQRDVEGMKNAWIATLTELSLLDFLRAKHIRKDELLQVFKWWNDLGLNNELKLARNQPVKWYTWSMAILIDDISSSEQRVQLTKSIAFIYLIDDIFDLYGTPDELTIFTEAVKKWDYGAMEMMPNYMKLCYKSLLDTTNEIGRMIGEKHGYNPINSLKQTWASLCAAFLVEAKWFSTRNLPGAEEYLANGKVSSGVHVVLVHLFFLLGENTTNLDDVSTLISCVAAILRLWDDLGTAEDEHQNGRDGSYIECCINDEPRLAFEQARERVGDMIESEWKWLNKECFNLNNRSSSSSSSSFQEAALNLARMVPLMYSYDDNQQLPLLKEYVKHMLQSPASPWSTFKQNDNSSFDLELEI